MNYTQQIEEIIQSAMTEKTFSLEIIGRIKDLKDGFDVATKKIEELEDTITRKEQIYFDLLARHDDDVETLKTYQEREKTLCERESKMERMEYVSEYQEKRANEIKELFGIVFRNSEVKRSIYSNTNVPVPTGNGCVSTYSGNESREETETIK